MGNQCAGLKEKSNFSCMNGAKTKTKGEAMLDKNVRLSTHQMDLINEYSTRFVKECSPTKKFFDSDLKIGRIDPEYGTGYETDQIHLDDDVFEHNDSNAKNRATNYSEANKGDRRAGFDQDKYLAQSDSIKAFNQSKNIKMYNNDGRIQDIDNAKLAEANQLELGSQNNKDSPRYGTSDDESDSDDEPLSSRIRYKEATENDDEDYTDSFGKPNFNHILNKDEEIEGSPIKIFDYEQGIVQFNKEKFKSIAKGYTTPSLGSARDKNRFEIPDEDSPHNQQLQSSEGNFISASTNQDYYIELNNYPKNGHKSRNQMMGIELDAHAFKSCEEGHNFKYPGDQAKLGRNNISNIGSRVNTQPNLPDNDSFEDLENLSFLKGSQAWVSSRGGPISRVSNSNVSNTNAALKMGIDASAIEVNQSQDYDEFDDVLNSLNKGFKQRESKKRRTYAHQ